MIFLRAFGNLAFTNPAATREKLFWIEKIKRPAEQQFLKLTSGFFN